MTGHPTPLERLIDALQAALLQAQALDRTTHDLADDSRRLSQTLQEAGPQAHALGPSREGER